MESVDGKLGITAGLAFIGILGGAIYVATTLGSDASVGQVLSSVFLPAIPTGIAGYFLGNKFDKKEYNSKKEKQTKEIKKFQIDATYDIQALKSAMYE
ncbi:hypothetical protein HN814_07470 [Candidatus Woesearchaeota archaeon]|jgi:hypothetical protein|nr:hypothetical protein [Candidatus Woesearchaeota archaeon]